MPYSNTFVEVCTLLVSGGVARTFTNIWDKVFKSRSSKICGKQPLKNLKGYPVKSLGKMKRGRPMIKSISNIKEWCDGSISDCIHWAQVHTQWRKCVILASKGKTWVR